MPGPSVPGPLAPGPFEVVAHGPMAPRLTVLGTAGPGDDAAFVDRRAYRAEPPTSP
ncbi:hypothetical protein ABTZ59_28215 [Streptomyces sp. NPDC094034]|uniref:hypothetical protein n=1 Tax=Streptomyces sp. NPDC094034 TaxID=3155309 RepID=UPI00331762AF